MLDAGIADIVMVIPHNFSRDIIRGVPADIQLQIDAENANLAGIAAAYATGMILDFAEKRSAVMRTVSPGPKPEPARIILQSSVLYNPQLKYRKI